MLTIVFNVGSNEMLSSDNKDSIEKDSSDEISKLLEDAEKLRSNNTIDFSNILSELHERKNQFSPEQQCYFDFLNSYLSAKLGKYTEGLSKLEQISIECDDINLRLKAKSLLANLYAISHKYQKAITSLDYVITHIDETNDKDTKTIAFAGASIVYDLFDQFELSIKFAELLIDNKSSKTDLCKGQVLKYRSHIKLYPQKDYSVSVINVVEECKRVGENIYALDLYVNWIKSRFKTSTKSMQFNLLLSELLKENEKIDTLNYKDLIGLKNSLLAQLYYKTGKYQQAIDYAVLTITNSKTQGTTGQKIDALQVLIDYYQGQQDYKTANRYLIEKSHDEKRMYSDEQARLIAYQIVKHDNLAKTHQIKVLNNKNEMLILEQEIDEKEKRDQKIINAFFAVLLSVFILLVYRSRKQHQKFKRLSELDHMTLIYNRKGIKDFMDYLLPYSEKKNETIGYGIYDLDLFKKINDKYGHVTGDWVIKKVIDVCKSLSNDKVTFARLGGEEFAIIMRDTTLKETIEFSEQCRRAIEAIVSTDEIDEEINITASFGVTTTKISGYDYTKLMTHADDALYDSKHAGRNRISVYK